MLLHIILVQTMYYVRKEMEMVLVFTSNWWYAFVHLCVSNENMPLLTHSKLATRKKKMLATTWKMLLF